MFTYFDGVLCDFSKILKRIVIVVDGLEMMATAGGGRMVKLTSGVFALSVNEVTRVNVATGGGKEGGGRAVRSAADGSDRVARVKVCACGRAKDRTGLAVALATGGSASIARRSSCTARPSFPFSTSLSLSHPLPYSAQLSRASD